MSSGIVLSTLLSDRLWHAQQMLSFGPVQLATRMTVVRLRDGGLWVHSPITPDPSLMSALAALGTVTDVVAPNRSHHLFFSDFLQACPGAQGWVAPGLSGKRPDLAHLPAPDAEAPWSGELVPYGIDGLPLIGETVFFHVASGTLILTDLLFCVGENSSGWVCSAARLLGIYRQLGMSRTMKLAVKDRGALAQSVEPLLSLPVERIVLAHDQVIAQDAQSALRAAFAWILPG